MGVRRPHCRGHRTPRVASQCVFVCVCVCLCSNQKPLQPYHTTQFAAAAKKQKEREDAATAGRMTYEQRRRYEIMRKEIEEVRALNPVRADTQQSVQRSAALT